MKVIRPFVVSDDAMISSNVPEADYPDWAVGTTYALGEYVQVTTYAATVTLTIGTPCTITQSNHGYWYENKVVFTTTGTLPTGLVAGRSYYIVQIDTNTYKVSNEKNGVPINTSGSQSGTHTATVGLHHVYESLSAGNLGLKPWDTVNSASWLSILPTNRWGMFDGEISSTTKYLGTITTVIKTTGRIDSLALLNVQADTVTISAVDTPTGTPVYNKTYSFNTPLNISNMWSYFFEPYETGTEFVALDLPLFGNMTITVSISSPNWTSVGLLLVGLSKDVGYTQLGASVGIVDYSVKSKDEFGNATITQRAYSKRGSFQVAVQPNSIDSLNYFLSKIRAIPSLFIGTEEFSATIIYGFAKDFSTEINYPGKCVCSLDIEGLI